MQSSMMSNIKLGKNLLILPQQNLFAEIAGFQLWQINKSPVYISNWVITYKLCIDINNLCSINNVKYNNISIIYYRYAY